MSLEPFAAYAATVLPGPAALALVAAAGLGLSAPRVVPPLLAVLSVFLPERLSKRALDAIKVLRGS